MSRKDDLDNHANQLNPNNDAYHSSRGWGGRDDDDDDVAVVRVRYRAQEPVPVRTLEQEFELTLVTLTGQTCLARVLISDTSRWDKDLRLKLENKADGLHQQVQAEFRRLSDSPIVYSKLSAGGRTIDELMLWEPSMPDGWANHQWKRIDRKEWLRLERTRSYRQQALEARSLLDQVVAQVEAELLRLAGMAANATTRALSDVALSFRAFKKVPVFRANALWASLVERARVANVAEVIQPIVDNAPGLAQALRTMDVLVRASNARAPASLRHPAAVGYGIPPSDAYGDYFGHTPCIRRLDEMGVWFTKGERRLRAVLAAINSGKLVARYDFGRYDITQNPDFYISKQAVERAMQPAKRRASAKAA